MAEPILLEFPERDPRTALQARLAEAPAEHAAALLAAYEVLQGLHDHGVFDLLRGALGSSDKLVEMAVDAAKSPEAIAALRNLFVLGKALAAIDPQKLNALAEAAGEALSTNHQPPPAPGLFKLLGKIRSSDFRRGLAKMQHLLEALGKS